MKTTGSVYCLLENPSSILLNRRPCCATTLIDSTRQELFTYCSLRDTRVVTTTLISKSLYERRLTNAAVTKNGNVEDSHLRSENAVRQTYTHTQNTHTYKHTHTHKNTYTQTHTRYSKLNIYRITSTDTNRQADELFGMQKLRTSKCSGTTVCS